MNILLLLSLILVPVGIGGLGVLSDKYPQRRNRIKEKLEKRFGFVGEFMQVINEFKTAPNQTQHLGNCENLHENNYYDWRDDEDPAHPGPACSCSSCLCNYWK